jgi:putative ABC transport system substrate-binding protein
LTTEERLSDIVGKQASTKYETVLNIKTAKALGLEVPPSVFAHADEVIE